MEPTTYSTAEVARRLGVSVQTIQRWVDVGRLRAWKTLGGHRRIDAVDANALFREYVGVRDQPAPEVANRRLSVLVVDDSELDRAVAVALVQEALPGAEVTAAASGFEALLAVGRHKFDALVTDIGMPHMNGFEMLRHLVLEVPNCPRFLLATSAHSASDLAAMGMLPEEVTLIRKPLAENGFGAWLASRLGEGRAPDLHGAVAPEPPAGG
jgi:excisionase family DNA binding protein